MRGIHGSLPIAAAFVFGLHVRDLTWAIETHAPVESASDLYLWLVVPASGLLAMYGLWRTLRRGPAPH